MRYQFLRLFLVAQERPGLLEAAGAVPPAVSRPEYLHSLFAQRIDFTHRQTPFVYIPLGSQQLDGGDVMLGRLGRSLVEIVNEPPEDGFRETELTSWRAANVLIDTRQHDDGQKIAMQMRSDIGLPFPILASLIDHLNLANSDAAWVIEISTLSDPATFWEAVSTHKGEITAAVFSFVTPNILRLRTSLNDSLKGAREDNNAHRVDVTLRNENGRLELDKPNVADSVDYITKGGGSAKLKAGKKIIYDSEKQERTAEVEDDETLMQEKKSTWKRLSDKLFK